MEYHGGYFWFVTQGSYNATVWKIHPDSYSITQIVTVEMELTSFLFDTDDNLIIVGYITDYSYSMEYYTRYQDGRIYKYDLTTQALSNFTDPNQVNLGWLSVCNLGVVSYHVGFFLGK